MSSSCSRTCTAKVSLGDVGRGTSEGGRCVLGTAEGEEKGLRITVAGEDGASGLREGTVFVITLKAASPSPFTIRALSLSEVKSVLEELSVVEESSALQEFSAMDELSASGCLSVLLGLLAVKRV